MRAVGESAFATHDTKVHLGPHSHVALTPCHFFRSPLHHLRCNRLHPIFRTSPTFSVRPSNILAARSNDVGALPKGASTSGSQLAGTQEGARAHAGRCGGACRALGERLVAAKTGGVVLLVHFHTVMNADLTQSLALCPQSPALTRERCSGAGKHARALISRLPSRWRDEVMADARACSITHSLSLGCCTGACGVIRRNGKMDCTDLVAAKRASRSFSCCLAFLKTSMVRTDG